MSDEREQRDVERDAARQAEYLTGDDEPEDGWDRGDPFDELVENLRRRLVLLVIVEEARNRLRREQLLEDLDWLRDRLRDEVRERRREDD